MLKGLKKAVKKGQGDVHTIQPVGGPWLPKSEKAPGKGPKKPAPKPKKRGGR